MTIFGRRDLWAIEIDPLPGELPESDPAAAATWASIRIWANGRNLTAHTRTDTLVAVESLHWPAVYLARWFLHSWPGFWERAGCPLPGPYSSAARVCTRIDEYIASEMERIDDEFLDRRDEFVASHTLLAAAAGGVMPAVYFLKDGPRVLVEWRDSNAPDSNVRFHALPGQAHVDAAAFLDATRSFMAWCADAGRSSAPAFSREIDAWLKALDSPSAAHAILEGFVRPWGARSRPRTSKIRLDLLDLPSGWESDHAALDASRFAVAVVFRALTPIVEEDDVAALLARLRSAPSNAASAARVDDLARGLWVASTEPPHQQGYALAQQVRERVGHLDTHLDVEALLDTLGVEVHDEQLSNDSIDAATVWDDRHGPVIITNKIRRHESSWARRMTLAHELCHLLIDKRTSMPLMIASTAWAPAEIERRANAFAAELLLPVAGIRRIAHASVSGWPFDEAVRSKLMDEFEVGETVCRHQLENRLRVYE